MFWTLAIICRRKWILLSFRRTWAFQLEKQYSGKQYAFRILILGFGAIGMEIAKRLRPFGVKILATKRNWSSNTVSCDLDGLVDKKGGPEDMYELVREADIVITCMTLNNESVGIVDHKFLSALKKGSYLINIARGRLLDYMAVFNHLESGHLGGLGIDVAWTEPFDQEDPILKFPNVIITPHVAGITELVCTCFFAIHRVGSHLPIM
ncbi:putative 2-hydroxyacid dehydrogenase HI_1556 isoform X1 [Triticum dicoccoides]|uniref:putative 2-hydroxyacid dehydrogenase HI_1556 isoform X1 n=1 Tax=Triticum dicoccoides TaxID=85692 RepID=UPI00188DFBAD|nr:putative 2-hydroxyacid dehydrogenase HI_1556 isoform X1 [Triticum dicoccoides]